MVVAVDAVVVNANNEFDEEGETTIIGVVDADNTVFADISESNAPFRSAASASR